MTEQSNSCPTSPDGFITVTPLQCHIAKKIIKVQKIKNYVCLNVNPHESASLRRKFSELSEGAMISDYLISNKKAVENISAIAKIARHWKNCGVTRVALASIDNVLIQYFLYKLNPSEIETFDDGAVNIIESGLYGAPISYGALRNIKYFFLRGNFSAEKIKSRTAKHYTMYPDHLNVINAPHYQTIHPFCLDQKKGKFTQGSCRVLLGAPKVDFMAEVWEKVNPDIYIPHPMENVNIDTDVQDRELLAEERIFTLLEKFETVEVYALNSTVLLNISSPRLKKIVLRTQYQNTKWQDQFDDIARTFGCVVENVTLTGMR